MLFKNSVVSSTNANCTGFDEYCTPAFEFRSSNRQKQELSSAENNDQDLDKIISFMNCLGDKTLTDFQENIIYYIAGYIVRNLIKQSTCTHCNEILLNKNSNNNQISEDHSYASSSENFKRFTQSVTRGGLIFASDAVFKILTFSEKQFRYLVEQGGLLKKNTNLKRILVNTAINYFSDNIQIFYPKHPVVEEFLSEECHEVQLVRKIIEVFLKCRMPHHSKLINIELHGKAASIRHKMSKIILFKNC